MIPGKIPSEADQQAAIAEIDAYVERMKRGEIELYFFDPCHCIHNNLVGYEWQFKGEKQTKTIRSNTGRQRINVLGGLNVKNLKPYVLITEANCDSEAIMVYLEELRRFHEDGKTIVLILDNAPYNQSYEVGEKARALNIELKYLPAYCPNLNLIERLWKFLKKKVRINNYCATFVDFEQAIYDFFKDITKFENELQKLLTLNFEIIKAS